MKTIPDPHTGDRYEIASQRDFIAMDSVFEGLHPELRSNLDAMEIHMPNSIQARAIPLGLAGRDVLVCAQTGSGKTLTFLLPILQRLLQDGGLGVVLAPTDQLVQQVAAVAQSLVRGLPIRLGWPLGTDPQLLVETPAAVVQQGDLSECTMVAVDEADLLLCSFGDEALRAQREAIEELMATRQNSQLLLAMAHLTEAREAELLNRFPHIQQVGHIGTLVPTLRQCFHYFKGQEEDRQRKLKWILAEAEKEEPDEQGATLIFCAATKVSELQDFLRSWWSASSLTEPGAVDRFRSGEIQLLLATDVSARGLDFPQLRHVILYDVPTDATAFVHMAGRTARSGRTGLVTCIVEAGNAAQSRFDGKAIHGLKDGPQLSFGQKDKLSQPNSSHIFSCSVFFSFFFFCGGGVELPDFLAFRGDSNRRGEERPPPHRTGPRMRLGAAGACIYYVCFSCWSLLPVPTSAASHACSRALIQWLGGTFAVTVLLGC